MSGRLVSLFVVVAALTCYQQRSMPSATLRAPLFAFVYGAAAIVMVSVALAARPAGGVSDINLTASHWAPWLLVTSVAGIEIGVDAMYRAGWSISTASVSTRAIVAAILVIVGLVKFGELLTTARSAGLALCVIGAGLVAR